MKQIELKDVPQSAQHLCCQCGHLMRLIGSEPHPVAPKTELLTYCCSACEEFLVLPTQNSEDQFRGFEVNAIN